MAWILFDFMTYTGLTTFMFGLIGSERWWLATILFACSCGFPLACVFAVTVNEMVRSRRNLYHCLINFEVCRASYPPTHSSARPRRLLPLSP
jgi:hypothetical protein